MLLYSSMHPSIHPASQPAMHFSIHPSGLWRYSTYCACSPKHEFGRRARGAFGTNLLPKSWGRTKRSATRLPPNTGEFHTQASRASPKYWWIGERDQVSFPEVLEFCNGSHWQRGLTFRDQHAARLLRIYNRSPSTACAFLGAARVLEVAMDRE